MLTQGLQICKLLYKYWFLQHSDLAYNYGTRWLPSTELPDEQKGTHKLYDASSSSTAHKVDGQNFNINYSFPGASGYVVTDDVDIGGTIVQGMPVGVATKMGPYLVNQKDYDGILGLAFQGGNSSKS